MSGTDHSAATETGPQPVFILVRPQMGENIGAAARGMWNFGLDRMRLVSPRDGWPNPKATAMASGAARVLDNVALKDTTAEAARDVTHLYATTARPRDLTKTVMTPQEAMADAARRIAAGERVGVLFGPERAGLENDDVVRANTIISVPVNPAFASLNLAQCVLLVAYEWRRQQDSAVPEGASKARAATHDETEKLGEILEGRLDTAGFFWPEDKRQSLQENLRNLISRMPLTDADVRTLHGVFRALADKHPTSN